MTEKITHTHASSAFTQCIGDSLHGSVVPATSGRHAIGSGLAGRDRDTVLQAATRLTTSWGLKAALKLRVSLDLHRVLLLFSSRQRRDGRTHPYERFIRTLVYVYDGALAAVRVSVNREAALTLSQDALDAKQGNGERLALGGCLAGQRVAAAQRTRTQPTSHRVCTQRSVISYSRETRARQVKIFAHTRASATLVSES